jgi:uncharacterized protein
MTYTPKHFNVWAEIPVRDLEAGMAFYAAATGGALDRSDMGGQSVALFRTADPAQGVSANLFVGEPGPADRGQVVFLSIAGKVEDAMRRTADAGGQVTSEVMSIPPGRFVYIADPDGNRVGLFEPA